MRYEAVRDDLKGGYKVVDHKMGKDVMLKPFPAPGAAQKAAKSMNEAWEKIDALNAKRELAKAKRKEMSPKTVAQRPEPKAPAKRKPVKKDKDA